MTIYNRGFVFCFFLVIELDIYFGGTTHLDSIKNKMFPFGVKSSHRSIAKESLAQVSWRVPTPIDRKLLAFKKIPLKILF